MYRIVKALLASSLLCRRRGKKEGIMKSVEKREKSAARRIVALAGSFAAGALLMWSIGVAGSNTAKSEERHVIRPTGAAQIEQVREGRADDSSNERIVRGHSECSLQLD
jgi:hypothetical protein